MRIVLVAVSLNNVIGADNTLPWKKVPEDLEHFKYRTMNHIVIMGHQTHLSLSHHGKKYLPHRLNVIVTRGGDVHQTVLDVPEENAQVSLLSPDQLTDKVLEEYEEKFPHRHLCFIGGMSIYQKVLQEKWVDRVCITRIKETVPLDRVKDPATIRYWNDDLLTGYHPISKYPLGKTVHIVEEYSKNE